MLSNKEFMIVGGVDLNAIELPEGQPVVPDDIAVVLYNEALPVRAVLAKYSRLVFEAGQVLDIDDSKLADYETKLEIASYADDILLACSALFLHQAIKDVQDREKYEATHLARRLYSWLESADKQSYVPNIEITAETIQKYKGEIEEWRMKLR
ncbi:hypothetical protein [Peribacillus asahii]|uniref:hypothetical protein n=1 Tax=Peribacillus asahii TaxID=228899 RepID=UPI00207ACD8A|nr:hypothetical protein [Peribacillus asahii]USK70189.1 hypothetical protein LIS76_22340 [Peribacillus asahii]